MQDSTASPALRDGNGGGLAAAAASGGAAAAGDGEEEEEEAAAEEEGRGEHWEEGEGAAAGAPRRRLQPGAVQGVLAGPGPLRDLAARVLVVARDGHVAPVELGDDVRDLRERGVAPREGPQGRRAVVHRRQRGLGVLCSAPCPPEGDTNRVLLPRGRDRSPRMLLLLPLRLLLLLPPHLLVRPPPQLLLLSDGVLRLLLVDLCASPLL